MAKFIGTEEEFRKYIGPKVRNIVQQEAKAYKQDIGECQICKTSAKDQLEAAHVRGKDRNTLVRRALNSPVDGEIIEVNLSEFEDEFRKLHYPINETIRVLCKSCHRQYDKSENIKSTDQDNDVDESGNGGVLPIDLSPSDVEEFKKLLLQSRRADIRIIYDDGREDDIKEWKADNLKDKSNVIGNLRSRPEFRQGNWQKNRIARVIVTT